MRKYGLDKFSFEVIEECRQEDLNDREIYWIKYYDSTNTEKGYNIKLGGNSGGNIYNYKQIYDLWSSGMSCKSIMDYLSCGD